jgi:hypothetical protein
MSYATNSQHYALSLSLSRLHVNNKLNRHAGNLLACPDGRLCYLDFGMMSYADTNQRNGFLLAVVVGLHLLVDESCRCCQLDLHLSHYDGTTNLDFVFVPRTNSM